MTRTSAAVLGLAALLGLSGCASGPQVVEENGAGITLRWYHWDSDIRSATMEADRRCGMHGKRAELVQESVDQDVTVARFACR
jgi:hypothetical protein